MIIAHLKPRLQERKNTDVISPGKIITLGKQKWAKMTQKTEAMMVKYGINALNERKYE